MIKTFDMLVSLAGAPRRFQIRAANVEAAMEQVRNIRPEPAMLIEFKVLS